jgi:uncharacterized protein (DUF3820 family)
MNYLHQPRNEHQRRKMLNGALGTDAEFVAPESDRDLQVSLPFGKYKGLTLGQVLEENPAYLDWMSRECDLREGRFAEAFGAVCCRYQERIEGARRTGRSGGAS